jgi:drug/metabolite transporter (DMT)-like permease
LVRRRHTEPGGPVEAAIAPTAAPARIPPAAWVAGLTVVVLWATAFPAIRVAVPGLGVVGLSATRLVVASVTLLGLAPLLKIRRPRRGDLPRMVACGFFGMAAYQLLLNWGELSVPAGTASMIVAAAPLISTAIAMCFLGETVSLMRAAGMAVAVTGVIVVCASRAGFSAHSTVWFVVAAMIAQGIYHPLIKPLLSRYTGVEVATYAIISGTVLTTAAWPTGWVAPHTVSVSGWLAAIYLGVLPTALGFVLWGYAVARMPVATSTALLYLVPSLAVLIAFLWLGEVPLITEIAGGAVVVAGVLTVAQGDHAWTLLQRHLGRPSKRERPPATGPPTHGSC